MAYYFDTSALVKLVVEEPETAALRAWLTAEARDVVSCDLARTELLRAVRRVIPEYSAAARQLLDSVTVLRVETADYDLAARLDPVSVRTLDAIHIASALKLGDELEGMVTYDKRLADGCTSLGIEVTAPS